MRARYRTRPIITGIIYSYPKASQARSATTDKIIQRTPPLTDRGSGAVCETGLPVCYRSMQKPQSPRNSTPHHRQLTKQTANSKLANSRGLTPARKIALISVVKPKPAIAIASNAVSTSAMRAIVTSGKSCNELKPATATKIKANYGTLTPVNRPAFLS